MISPEVGELLPAAPTFDSEREAEVEFTTCGFRAASGNFTEVIYIGDIDNKALVAVPFEVWHRNSPKRKLGAALARPVLVGLAACTAADRETLLEEVELRVWLGLMAKDIAAQLELVTDRASLDYAFGVDGNRGFLPHVRALAGVAWEQFQFVSAESAADVEEEPLEDFGVPNGSGEMAMNPEELGPRVVALEDMLQQLSQNVSVLVNKLDPGLEPEVEKKPKRKSKFVAPTAKSAPSTPSVSKDRKSLGFAARYPSLDASVVSAALAAGVEPDHLEEMEKLMGSSLHGAKKLREPALKKKVQVAPVEPDLSESEDDEPFDDSGGVGDQANPSVQSSLDRLTEIVGLLTAEQARKAKTSKVDQALDGVTGATSSDAPSGGSSKRAAAARRVLRQALLDHPEDISALVEKLMLEDLTHRVQAPGLPSATLNARAWVEHRSRLGPHKTAAFCCWSAAGILDDLIAGKPAHARAKAALLILQLDQTAIDRGSWVFSSELSLEQSPPFAALASHSLPAVGDGESPFSHLLDGRWAEICLSHLKDTEDFLTKRRALGKKSEEVEKDKEKERARAKEKAKAKASSENKVTA